MSRSLKSRLGALEQSTGRRDVQPSAHEESVQRHTLQSLGFTYEDMGEGSFWHRMLSYDVLSLYGQVRFQDIQTTDLSLLAKACKLPAADVEANLRFYDTETTGLGTGAGTFPFLHAVGQIEDDEWVIHQYFVDDFAEEPALLSAIVRRHFRDGGVCITFNGKSFDWPLFLNRLVMYRIERPEQVRQMDLLHPSRRLWRRKLQRVSLGHVEEGIMGVRRTDDLPGREAPARYFSYLQDQDVEKIRPVLDHNAADVSALLGLSVVLADVLGGHRDVATAGEYAALGKWRDEWEDYDLADKCWRSATQCPDATWREFWLSSLRYKRLREWDKACAVWEHMAAEFTWSTNPLIELAKYYEHRAKDFSKALAYAQVALQRARSHSTMSTDQAVVAAVEHRIHRIQRRLDQSSANEAQ
ncbi:ribonuclease H-like domain-containing protein [Alicyclobacillus sp. SO9]|uniref:ribonuclease H-like domain-containing protein n=1 Tax=Alicyclobacillus sp. SO9 TaxID=2665646 RepID=UPI0018E741AE|nr:ribonuclease H-like domain-containing protein [Alicyclobacillus sp. SO9]QQE79489.1 ribonuclease H-like domain-containing protein [Alicyclobacillus sp. SO9]